MLILILLYSNSRKYSTSVNSIVNKSKLDHKNIGYLESCIQYIVSGN